MTDAHPQPLVLGRVVGLFGVRGWVKVFSYTEPREAILDYSGWLLRSGERWQPVEVAEGKRHGKSILVRFEGTDDRDAATVLIGRDIGVGRGELPEPGEGRYYWADLEGMRIVREDGTELGRVAYVMETGANDVLVTDGEPERLIPFVTGEIVLDVDTGNGVITVDWEWD